MILKLNFSGDTPIYAQIHNQIIMGIADGSLKPGDRLPTVRALADESGVNMMTVSKAYQILKQEGYITADRRSGAVVSGGPVKPSGMPDRAESDLKLIISEAIIAGISKSEFLSLCDGLYDNMEA